MVTLLLAFTIYPFYPFTPTLPLHPSTLLAFWINLILFLKVSVSKGYLMTQWRQCRSIAHWLRGACCQLRMQAMAECWRTSPKSYCVYVKKTASFTFNKHTVFFNALKSSEHFKILRETTKFQLLTGSLPRNGAIKRDRICRVRYPHTFLYFSPRSRRSREVGTHPVQSHDQWQDYRLFFYNPRGSST